MSRRPMMAANWKMHKTISEAINTAVRLKYACQSIDDRDVVLCPTFTSIKAVAETVSESMIEVGAQNMHYASSGAYTGEVSPPMVEDAGAEWVILGHSERRQYFGEDDDLLAQKLDAAAEQGFKVFFCIGETEQERDDGRVREVLTDQLRGPLGEFDLDQFEELVVAYEPIWAIGTGQSASPDQADEAHETVREVLDDLFGDGAGQRTRVIYGGSVKPNNVEQLMAKPNLDGALVGSASLNSEDFSKIIKYNIEDEIEIPSN
jgi:triosephosphate isomerase